METAVLTLPDMGRRKADAVPEKVEHDDDIVRVPVKMTRAQRAKLNRITMFWLRGAAEVIAGSWLVERLEAEEALGEKGAVAAYLKKHPEMAKKFGIEKKR
jgi:hypothetical protein